ncbi:MAG TPA: ATP-binding protein, partial [Gammaproteobacteria bacterium]|nr:ATP-binding protein [Gammaproteobacteria bacterium]
MTRLIDDMLEISRINTGRITLQLTRVNINDVIRNAVEQVQPFIQASKQTITLSLCEESLYLQADAARLEQVLGNLLNNASKYTAAGGHIELSCEQVGEGHIVIHVIDNGSGITPDLLPHVFELFTQAEKDL